LCDTIVDVSSGASQRSAPRFWASSPAERGPRVYDNGWARPMIEAAERDGRIGAGATLVEATTG